MSFSTDSSPPLALEAELSSYDTAFSEPPDSGEYFPGTAPEVAVTAAHSDDAPAIDAAISGENADFEAESETAANSAADSAATSAQKTREINGKAKRGIKMMMGRQAILQILTFGGGILLARLLTPATFGVYSIITFLVSISGMLGNFGLAPSLVQRRGEINERDLRVAFTMQQALITVIVAILMVAAPALIAFYPAAPPSAVWLLRAMAFSLYLTSWRTMSKLQLERAMSFDKIARVEVFEVAIYQGLAVVLALCGWGIWSFVIAALARGAGGTLLSYYYAPWRVRFAWDRGVAMELLRFGLPFQAETITQSIGGWITPVFVGAFIGPQAVGYLTFASSNGRKPLMLADSFIVVSFPHFSRLQDDLPEIERILVRYLTYLLLAAGGWSAMLVCCGGSLVELIYSAKWRPSEGALAIFSVAMAADIILRLVSVATTARGDVKQVWSRTAMRTLAQLLFAIPALYFWGFNGVPLAYLAAMTTTMPFLFTLLGRGAMKRVLWPLSWIVFPWLISIVFGMLWMHSAMPDGDLAYSHWQRAASTLGGISIVTAIYAITAYFLSPAWLKRTLQQKQNKVLRRS